MMDYKTVSLSDQVFEHLEENILSGVYQRGDIITEMQLCQELGVSRTPIREALRRLFQEHLIEDTSRGTMVLGITPKDFRDMSEIRLRIEDLAVRGFIKNATEDDLKALNEAVDFQEFYLARSDIDQLKALDGRFHEMIYAGCGSMILRDTLAPLHKKIQQYRRNALRTPDRAAHSVREHRAILEAIQQKDGDLAAERMKQHIENALERGLTKEEA
ncbi:MAG: GntR family transcriptional regulator [Clostridia bacterium]|nr:GntR family transcriptional regulator [Clostridia bacterium]MBQ3269729.1 GntR family transcriptional regulator [Clostridia bacterium]